MVGYVLTTVKTTNIGGIEYTVEVYQAHGGSNGCTVEFFKVVVTQVDLRNGCLTKTINNIFDGVNKPIHVEMTTTDFELGHYVLDRFQSEEHS